MTESASSTSGQEFDVFSVMDWKDGVGTLPGSDLKVGFLSHVWIICCVYLCVSLFYSDYIHKIRIQTIKYNVMALYRMWSPVVNL